MADNEKDIPVKELEDGSAQVAYELEPDPLEDVEVEGEKKKKKEDDKP